jgi:hypothetical protein
MGKGLKFLGQSEYDDKYQSSLSLKDENRVNYSDVVTSLKDRDAKGSNAVFLTERLPLPHHHGHHGHDHHHQSRGASSSDQTTSHDQTIVKEQARKTAMTKAIPPQMYFSTETGDKYTWPSEKKQQQQQQQQMPSKSPSIELNKSRVLIGNQHPIITTATTTATVKEKRKKALTGNSYSTTGSTGSTGRSPYGYFNSSSSTSELQSESRSKYLWPKSKLDVGKAPSRRPPSSHHHHPHQQQQHPHHHHQSTPSSSPQLDLISTSDTTINRNVSDNRTAAPFRQSSYSFPSNGSQDSTAMTTDSLAVVIPTVAPSSSESIDDSTIVVASHPHPRPAANDDVTMNSTSSYSLNGGELSNEKSSPTLLHTTSIITNTTTTITSTTISTYLYTSIYLSVNTSRTLFLRQVLLSSS